MTIFGAESTIAMYLFIRIIRKNLIREKQNNEINIFLFALNSYSFSIILLIASQYHNIIFQ